jgi:hypothetical protein
MSEMTSKIILACGIIIGAVGASGAGIVYFNY